MGRRFRRGDRVAAYGYQKGKVTRFGKGTVTRPSPAQLGDTTKELPRYIKVHLDDGLEIYFPERLCKRLVPKPQLP